MDDLDVRADGIGGEADAQPWPMRTLLFAGLGLVAALSTHWLLGGWGYGRNLGSLQLATITGVLLAAALIGFTLERRLWWASIAFSLATALVAALVIYWNGAPDQWGATEAWRSVSLFLAVAVAAPLFQAARDEGAVRFPYASVHDHAWTNIVLWFACWLFVAIVFALAWLLASLFGLIKIELLSRLLREEWFWRALIGLAFGSALGLLREHDRVVHLLQRVVATVLAVLAPVLATGLVVFLLALPFTGLQALWGATSATTPVLLCCAVGALILSNAVIGNATGEERRFPLLRYGAMALAATLLPLAVLAAVAMELRIGQYGYTPQRLWGVVFVGLACLYGAGYLVALVRGRTGWAERVRPMNLTLAFVVCGVALVLATPLISFNAISTRDQVARLESGRLTPEKFDWRALAFDFGKPGRDALKRLQGSGNAAIRERALQAGEAEDRWSVPDTLPTRADVSKQVRVLPAGSPAPPVALLDYLARQRCGAEGEGGCTLVWIDATTAMLLRDSCFAGDRQWVCTQTERVHLADGKWAAGSSNVVLSREEAKTRSAAQGKAYAAGQVDVRNVERRQVFVGGEPVGEAFE